MVNFLTTPVLYGLAAVAVLAGVTAGVQTVRVAGLKAEVQAEKRKAETIRADQAEAVRQAIEDDRQAQADKRDADLEVMSHAYDQAMQLALDNAAAVTASDKLRRAAEATARRCPARPTVTASAVSPAASSAGDLFAYVQRRLDQAAGGIGDFAESAHTASTQCAGFYGNAVKASQ